MGTEKRGSVAVELPEAACVLCARATRRSLDFREVGVTAPMASGRAQAMSHAATARENVLRTHSPFDPLRLEQCEVVLRDEVGARAQRLEMHCIALYLGGQA